MRNRSILFCKMNAVRYIVLASVSIITVKTIRRIPLNLFHRTHPEGHYSEDYTEIQAQHRRANNLIDTNTKKSSKSSKTNGPHLKFTDFILEAAKVLKTYENKLLEDAFVVIDDEVWDNMYNGCKANELGEIRRYAADLLAPLKDASADELRHHLDNVVNIIKYDNYGDMAVMINFVNSLYVEESEKFVEVLLSLVHKRISEQIDLRNIINHALKYIIFDHYCALDDSVRRELIKMILHYWKQFKSRNDNKMGRNINAPLATPFVYDKRNKKVHKKRRFNTVNEGRPLKRNNDDDSSFDELKKSRAARRVGTQRTTTQTPSSSSEESDFFITKMTSTEWETTNESMPIKVDAVRENKTIDENVGSENDLATTKKEVVTVEDEVKTTMTEKRLFTEAYRANEMLDFMEPHGFRVLQSTRVLPAYANNTIDKLIKIGDLAKEINHMIRTNKKILRQGTGWESFNALFNIIGSFGMMNVMPTTPQKVNEMNGKKDILISMNAKYQD